MATRDLRSYFTCQKNKKSQTSIPESVETTGNVAASDASAVNTFSW